MSETLLVELLTEELPPKALKQLGEAFAAQLRSVLLTTTEHDRDLDLVALLQEPHDVTRLGLVVVRVDLRPELHLLDDHVGLVAASLTSLLSGLVLELAVVHELGHRWTGHRCNLDEIEVGLLSEPQGILDPDDADLLSVRTDQPHLWDADPVVDTRFDADEYSLCELSGHDPGAKRAPREDAAGAHDGRARPRSA